ncbi:MAG: DUF2194 domain-containing protein [Calditrichaeota bacterium]|nr:DUF2194 domain-containing protein [Calditrichota bacterium]
MMRHNLKNVFLIALIVAIAGCSGRGPDEKIKFSVRTTPLDIRTQPTLLLSDHSDKYGMMCRNQAVTALRYAKIPFVEYDLSRSVRLPDLRVYRSVVTVTENLWKLDEIESQKLKKYVSGGGGLAIFYRSWNEYLPDLFGVKNRREPQFVDNEQRVVFVEAFLPGGEKLTLEKEDVSNYTYRLENQAELIAKTDKYPIAWFHEFGKGKVIYWNTGMLARKINRGFIVRSIAAVQPFTVAALANVAIFDLDDFPNACYNVKSEPIKSEFDMTIAEFYTLKWYPDLIKLAREYGLKYTSALIFNYNGLTKPPFNFFEWLNGKITLGGKTVSASLYAAKNLTPTTELGLHGYNHQSLSMKFWHSAENMKSALQAGKKRWQIENLGELPQSYVPPLNIYDSTGVAVLHQVFPSIQQIGALYLGKFELGQFREFAPEPWNQDLYVIPRNTSGYIMTDFFRQSMISLLNCNGVWAHFIHPDDVYPNGERYSQEELADEHIASLSWYGEPRKDGLYYQLRKWLDFARENYPYLRHLKRREALPVLRMFDRTKVGATCQKNIINVETNVVPSYFAVYLAEPDELEGVLGCKLVHKHKTTFGVHLIIKATDHVMMLQFKNPIQGKGGL